MAATTPVKKVTVYDRMDGSSCSLREASNVKKMNDRALIFCLNKITH